MITTKLILPLILVLCGALSEQVSGQLKLPFSFSLQNGATTSAGVFSNDGTLVRTLWSGVKYSAGNHTDSWDGLGDDGRLVQNADYDIRVLSNNVNYSWAGIIGNTSSSFTGPSIWRGYLRLYSMAISGNTAYESDYYNEGRPSQSKFNLNNPQSKIEILSAGQSSMFVATDGTTVYWAGDDVLGGHTKWFVFGTNTSDDLETNFSGGQAVAVTFGRTYVSGVDVMNNINANISGLAVQKTGKYLFIAHQNINEIHVLDKTTGASVQTITTFTAPSRMAVDGNDNLWLFSSAGVNKYTVNSDGTLTAATLTLSGILEPWAIAVSPDNSTVVVADGSTSQQLKAFSNSTGTSSWTYGQAGGYATDPTVANDKLYFTDQRHSNDGTFIAFQTDGSFWVEDAGNYRVQHFSPNRTFIDRIMYMPAFYGTSADPNNPSRIFADFLEFNVDYSMPLAPNNNSWTLVKNWGQNVDLNYNDHLRSVTTLANGRTYAFVRHTANSKYAVVELPGSGNLRYTGIETNDYKFQLEKDGSMSGWGTASVGNPTGYNILPLTGFDGSNNPIWGAAVALATIPSVKADDPGIWGSGNPARTTSDILVFFDAGLPPYCSTNYHLGGIKAGTNKWLWRTAKSTFKEYSGPFPNDGAYDIGNLVQYAGSSVLVLDRNIIWGYHGEFWKQGETNYYNDVYDDGLLVAQFGTSGGVNSPAGLAGNALALSLVKDANGNGYLYTNDESVHGGIHQWQITGLNTIQEQIIPVVLTPTVGGLLGQYYDGNDLNNFNTKSAQIDSTVNNNPIPVQIPNKNNFSTRWSGFILPIYSESYEFYTNTGMGVKLWVDGNLIVNYWNNNGQKESSGSLTLEAGKRYSIKLEINGGAASLSWSSPSQPKQIIPSGNLIPAAEIALTDGVDLLEGLPSRSILEDKLYGWQRDLKIQDTSGVSYNNWWSIKTSVQSYAKPDVFVKFVEANRNVLYTVTRDLGTQSGPWKLSGHLSHDGDSPGAIDNGFANGTFVVLDNEGKVIVSLAAYINYQTGEESLFGNKILIAKAPSAVFNGIWGSVQPLNITADGGLITIAFGPYSPISTPALDPTSNWQNPKTMALYFGSNLSTGTRSADILDMRFFASNFILLPSNILSIKAEPIENKVDILWSTDNEINSKSFIVERSDNAKSSFFSIGSVNAKNTTGVQNYSFVDVAPLDGTNYYRLEMTDIDGKFKYSPIVSVYRSEVKFSVYPNPVKNTLQVHHPAITETGSSEIISAGGRMLKSSIIAPGVTTTSIDVSSLYSGYYLLKIRNGYSIITIPFIKQ